MVEGGKRLSPIVDVARRRIDTRFPGFDVAGGEAQDERAAERPRTNNNPSGDRR
jgi:hypothetical protein